MRYLKLDNLLPKILFKLFFILYWTFIFGLGHTINKGKGYSACIYQPYRARFVCVIRVFLQKKKKFCIFIIYI